MMTGCMILNAKLMFCVQDFNLYETLDHFFYYFIKLQINNFTN